MIPTLLHVINAIRRALKRANQGLSLVADAFSEAMDDCHAARRKYPFAE